LFFLGLILGTRVGVTLQKLRICGVLQRFGVAYGAVSLLQLAFASTKVSKDSKLQRIFQDITIIWKQWIVIVLIICAHVSVIFIVKLPNCDRGYLGPGGMHEFGKNENCTGGVIGYIDRLILRESHMFQNAEIREIYDSLVFDPEGIFGSLMTIFQVFLGVQCGMTLLIFSSNKDRLSRWILWGILLAAVTLVLTLFSVNDGFIPINKNMWSLSFVTATSSLAFLLLSIIYYLVDMKKFLDDFWTIFLYPGMNAIILYVGHAIFYRMWPFHFYVDVMNTHFIYLLENLWTVTVWILISHYLYRNKIFYSI
jgi:heparan-alpha-glucosaminide N-acetyltransferase